MLKWIKFVLTIMLLNPTLVFAQKNTKEICIAEFDTLTGLEVYLATDIPAEVKGGMGNLYNEMKKIIRYPKNIKRRGVESKISIAFVVTEDGSIIGQRIIQNIAETTMAEQLLEIVTNLAWDPGMCNGKPVKTLFILPMIIDFK